MKKILIPLFFAVIVFVALAVTGVFQKHYDFAFAQVPYCGTKALASSNGWHIVDGYVPRKINDTTVTVARYNKLLMTDADYGIQRIALNYDGDLPWFGVWYSTKSVFTYDGDTVYIPVTETPTIKPSYLVGRIKTI